MTVRHWSIGIGLCCAVFLSGCVVAKTKVYERHTLDAYDAHGNLMPGYATLNLEYLDALDADLEACYKDKHP